MAPSMSVEDLILHLYDIQAVKFGSFTLKSGIQSPVYFDLRVIVSYPKILREVAEHIWQVIGHKKSHFVSVCGVPYTALPIATCVCINQNIPMLIRRKEAKDYGTKKLIEGQFQMGDSCLIIEDVVTSGSSVLETAQTLSQSGIVVKDAVVLLDREQGGRVMLLQQGIELHSVCTVSQLLTILQKHRKIDVTTVNSVCLFIQQNQMRGAEQAVDNGEQSSTKKMKKSLTYTERVTLSTHPLTKKLLRIMDEKQTNLCIAIDLTDWQKLLQFAEQLGPYICCLKTHVDILSVNNFQSFRSTFGPRLNEIANKHNFLIFEDRKFADIGNTVQHQYGGGIYYISDWAHIVNAHCVPGPGVVEGLKKVVNGGSPTSSNRACLLIAEMSSEGSLATGPYTKGISECYNYESYSKNACVKMAEQHKDFIIGFISQGQVSENPMFIHFTPGVQLDILGDGLGQQYNSPKDVIGSRKSDIMIVGRGIINSDNPLQAAQLYRQAGWEAYLQRLQ